MQRLGFAVLAVLLVVLPVQAQQVTNFPSQLNPNNTSTVSTANAAAVKTLTGVVNRTWRIDGLSAFCSAGTATVTIAEAGTTTWLSSTGWVGTTIVGTSFKPPYTAVQGATVVITLSTCGSSNTGRLNVQAEIR